MSIILNGTTGITTPDVDAESYTGPLAVNASAPDDSVVVDASGNVGIGTSSPAYRLDVSATGFIAARISTSYSGSGNIRIEDATTTANAPYIGSVGDNLAFGRIGVAERARIDSSGNLLVGTTTNTDAGKLTIAYSTGFNNGIGFLANSTVGMAACIFRNPNGAVGSIVTSGTTTNYSTSSDYRLKEDWVAVADASTRVNALKPVNFAWKADGKRVDGFLAHELAEVVPEAVTGEKDAVELVDIKDEDGNVTGQEERPVYQGIDQSKLVPLLTAALQEALAKIDNLTARVSALEASNV